MNDTITIKQLSQELKVSEQALRQWCKKNNIRKERTQGTKASYVIAFDTEKQIRAYYSNKSNETKVESTERKDGNQSNETKETIKASDNQRTFSDVTQNDTVDDLRTEYIESLKAQIEDLKADKQFLQDRLAAAEHDRDVLTKERQTILAELLSLRGQPKITTAAETKQSTELKPERQVKSVSKRRRTLSERIRDFFK